MLEQKYYNFGNILKISVRANSEVSAQIDSELKIYRCKPFDGLPEILIDTYDFRPKFKISTAVDDYYYGEGFLQRPELKMQIKMNDERQSYYMDRLILPIDLIVQIGLIKQQHTLIHGAGVNFNGQNVLMPGFPGTGKTTIVASLMKSGGRLFGDDFCIVGEYKLYPYPKDITIDADQLDILDIKSVNLSWIFRKDKLLNTAIRLMPFKSYRFFKMIRLLVNNLKSNTVNLDPKIIFGTDVIAQIGQVDEIIFLERSSDVIKLEKENINAADYVSLASTILWHEWHYCFHHLLLYDALSSQGKWFNQMFKKVEKILKNEFEKVPLSIIRIPINYENSKLSAEILKILNEG